MHGAVLGLETSRIKRMPPQKVISPMFFDRTKYRGKMDRSLQVNRAILFIKADNHLEKLFFSID